MFGEESPDGRFERKSLILPAFDAADHLLHPAAKAGQSNGGPIGSVAVGAVAVDHEEGIGCKGFEVAVHDASVWKIHRAGNVAGCVAFRRADVEQHEIGMAPG